ncbi:MAG: alanine:cation symporter family protein [Clostridium baratii]|uniref:Amino acid carrier family protein n=1 Tax=Clostridium baratii str. Sullivan TaxID=1415775 RepID=A0A0A7FSH1_9CLOT|nr:alanine/glycine:cation symporter family protein [Clostridium baratii]AIY82518.1 amino acid carrier family protein [Clostridium baratii str. Sullivan]MBS6006500.1 alanine:cation symporter family protein [Clostridium baratii]MDU1053829.1 alanine/glycine:cation symporter family protein [Clostridium baratii]MDU4910732.1 alanine/glycine:cation symporter family protein [Clostridium baratii]CUO93160.1 amino acid carrier protein AlsT [Clostridium baratii]
MDIINDIILKFNDFLWTYILIALLLVLGAYFTIRTNFVQFRYLKEMFRLLGDGFSNKKEKGSISSFQAFCISTASRVGTGNLAGIAIAISVGGPGAIFWMWIIALIGAGSSFVESTLAQIYKEKNEDGSFRGGPAYYMQKGLNKKWMGVLFSVLITLAFGLVFNSVQSNTITESFNTAFGVNRLVIGIILTVLTALIIFGGIHRIAKVTEVLVPVMALAYIGIAVIILIMNATEIPSVLKLIVENAFGFKEVAGGTLGGALLLGIKRGLFSNEAGMGSAPNAAATANVTHPVKQGLIQTLGVFTDTLIICSCTAFIILLSGVDYSGPNASTGIKLTQDALSSQIGPFGNTFIAICILLFAFSSIVGNYYYGESNIEFLNDKKWFLFAYRVCVILMVLFGSVAKVDVVWNLADVFMGLMAIVNLAAIFMLSKYAFLALKDYTEQKKSGIKEPVFKASSIPGLKNAKEWE